MILTLVFAAATLIQAQGYDVWGTEPEIRSDTAPLKDRDSYIVAAGKATSGMGSELQRLKDAGKVLDPSKSLMPTVVPVADEINYLNDQLRQKINGDRMNAVNQSFTYLMANSDQPSFTGTQNPFVKHTMAPFAELPGSDVRVSRELGLAIQVANSGGDLAPADIMRMSLDACKGDLQSALLTSHNFLKELGYASRANAAGPAMFARIPGTATDRLAAKAEAARMEQAIGHGFRVFAVKQDDGSYTYDVVKIDSASLIDKLQNLRPANDTTSDKMGPWYHSFVGLVIGSVSTGGEITAGTWAKLEALMRTLSIFHLFSSPPDYFKELLTERMAAESGTLMDIMATSLKLNPARSQIDQGATQAFTLDAQRANQRSEVWFKWTFGPKGEPVWTRETAASHTYANPGEFPVTVEMYDNTKLSRLAKASGIVQVREVKVVKGSWNLVSAVEVQEKGFKDQVTTSTGGNNAWSGDPSGGRIYRSWGWGYEGTDFVSPIKYEAMHTWEIPKVLKPGTKVRVHVALTDIKYIKVDPAPSARGYAMSTGVYVSGGYLPDLAGIAQAEKSTYDGSPDMKAPTSVDVTTDWLVPAPVKGKDLVIRVRVGLNPPFVEFDLTYKIK